MEEMSATVATTIAQIIPVFFLAFILEARRNMYRRQPRSRNERKFGTAVNRLFLLLTWLVTFAVLMMEIALLRTIQNDGVAGPDAVAMWWLSMCVMGALIVQTVFFTFADSNASLR
jgi:hypothetical protein